MSKELTDPQLRMMQAIPMEGGGRAFIQQRASLHGGSGGRVLSNLCRLQLVGYSARDGLYRRTIEGQLALDVAHPIAPHNHVSEEQTGLNVDDLVDVQKDFGDIFRTTVKHPPYETHGLWVVHVRGIAGWYALSRVTPVSSSALLVGP